MPEPCTETRPAPADREPAPALGASLYLPAHHPDLAAIGRGDKLAGLRSVIFCTEDAVSQADLPAALANLHRALPGFGAAGPARHLRVRNEQILREVLAWGDLSGLAGVVLPKVTAAALPGLLAALRGRGLAVMPTLETRELFMPGEVERVRDLLLESGLPVPAVRLGGNDLLGLLGLRRRRGVTAYETPLGALIGRLAGQLIPWGLPLAAPVYDVLDDPVTLAREVRADLDHGLTTKTAVHPRQVPVIEAQYAVEAGELELAQATMQRDAPAVFQLGGVMGEPATHRAWAQGIVQRAAVFGVRDDAARTAAD